MYRYLLLLIAVSTALNFSAAQPNVGAYWSFQETQNIGVNDEFSKLVSVNTWPIGTPKFAYSGSNIGDAGNYG